MTMAVLVNGVPVVNPFTPTVSDTATIDLTLSANTLSGAIQPTSIDNSMVATSAAIARSKVATGTANRLVYNLTGTGALADAGAITASRALISDSAGIPTHSATTSTELGFVSGVTSAIQTQLTQAKELCVPFSMGVINLTNQAAAAGIIGTTAVTKVDLTNYTQIRLCVQKANLAGAAGSVLAIRYVTVYSTTAANFLAVSSAVCEVSLAGTSVFLDTGFLSLVAGAKADVFLALIAEGGDAAADPNFGNAIAYFR